MIENDSNFFNNKLNIIRVEVKKNDLILTRLKRLNLYKSYKNILLVPLQH